MTGDGRTTDDVRPASEGTQPLFIPSDDAPCQTCGACCAHCASWPRFTLESDAELARIPDRLVDQMQSGMNTAANRCLALLGEVGTWTSCSIYEVRPIVCRDCMPGDDACAIARSAVGLPVLAA